MSATVKCYTATPKQAVEFINGKGLSLSQVTIVPEGTSSLVVVYYEEDEEV